MKFQAVHPEFQDAPECFQYMLVGLARQTGDQMRAQGNAVAACGTCGRDIVCEAMSAIDPLQRFVKGGLETQLQPYFVTAGLNFL